MKILTWCVVVICSIVSGLVLGKSAQIRFKLNFFWPYPVLLTAFSCLYYFRFGLSKEYFIGILMLMVCLFFSASDIITRQVSDIMHVLFVAIGCANLSESSWVSMIMGAVFLGIIMLVAALVQKGTMGGADIKFSAAIGWLFGLKKGLLVLILGLLLSVINTLIFSFIKGKKQTSIPMIPYLGIACGIVYLNI